MTVLIDPEDQRYLLVRSRSGLLLSGSISVHYRAGKPTMLPLHPRVVPRVLATTGA